MSVYGFEKEYLKPDPKEDPEIFLGPRQKSAEKIASEIIMKFESGRPCKMVVFGLYGIGKTHLIFNVMNRIKGSVEPYYLECPSCHRRSRFVELQSAMMNKIGKTEFMNLLRVCFNEFEGRNVDIQNFLGIDGDFMETLYKGLENDDSTLWRYLVGQKITSAQAISLSAVKPQIDDIEASKIISITAKMFNKYKNQRIMFVIDEMEKTDGLVGDSMTAFRDAVRNLMDDGNSAGIMMLSTARDMQDFRLLNDDPIRRRIGLNNFKHFTPYEKEELMELMTDVIVKRRMPEFDVKKKISLADTNEKIDEKTYPFTKEALDGIIDHVQFMVDNRIGEIPAVRPNEVLQMMDVAMTNAKLSGLSIIEKKQISEVGKEFTDDSSPDEI